MVFAWTTGACKKGSVAEWRQDIHSNYYSTVRNEKVLISFREVIYHQCYNDLIRYWFKTRFTQNKMTFKINTVIDEEKDNTYNRKKMYYFFLTLCNEEKFNKREDFFFYIYQILPTRLIHTFGKS